MTAIVLPEKAAASVATPASGYVSIFADDADGLPKFKDDAGTVTSLVGAAGSNGEGVPVGGSTGQALVKSSATDYDTGWATVALDRSTVTSVSSSSGVVTLNYALGDYFTLTLTENVTSWVVSNPPGSGKGFSLMVQITQGAGPYTVAKPGTVPGGTLTVSTGSGDIDLLVISSLDNGSTLRSNLAADYS